MGLCLCGVGTLFQVDCELAITTFFLSNKAWITKGACYVYFIFLTLTYCVYRSRKCSLQFLHEMFQDHFPIFNDGSGALNFQEWHGTTFLAKFFLVIEYSETTFHLNCSPRNTFPYKQFLVFSISTKPDTPKFYYYIAISKQ